MCAEQKETDNNQQADVVVIGGGGAGMAAATAAAEKGARVILLEKRGLGGSSALAFNVFGADSPVQERAGITCRTDDCFRVAMEWAKWRINPSIVRAFIDKSADNIRWLEEKGIEFNPMPPMGMGSATPTAHNIKGRGYALIKALADSCKKSGAELLIHTPAKRILVGDNGELTGVVAEKDGEEFTIFTRSIIIGTGGFAGNKEMLKKYCPEYHDGMEIIGIPHIGDGIQMAMEIGAAMEGMSNLMLGMPRALHPPYDEKEDTDIPPSLRQMGLIGFASDARTLQINNRGKRFFDESIGFGGNAIVRQPENTCFSIFDSAFLQSWAEQGGGGPMPPGVDKPKVTLAEWEQYLKAKVKKGIIKICDSLDDIADWTQIHIGILKTTIDAYNNVCDQGYDPVFNKDPKYLLPLHTPPYYVIKWGASCLNTMGGIKINEKTEVLDKNDNPIPGLYAAGVDTAGGWESPTYCMEISGHAFGFSVISGQIAGENAADFVKAR